MQEQGKEGCQLPLRGRDARAGRQKVRLIGIGMGNGRALLAGVGAIVVCLKVLSPLSRALLPVDACKHLLFSCRYNAASLPSV